MDAVESEVDRIKPRFLIIDSIQTMMNRELNNAAGSPARADVPPAECVLRFSGAAETSTRVFQLPHIGQQPIHFTVSYPHSPQTNFVFSFIKNLPQPFFRFAVFERFFGISERPFYSGGRAYLIMSRSREVTSIHIT